MILAVAAVLWLVCLVYVTVTPRLRANSEARRNAQGDLYALGALGVLTAGFFWQLLFTSNTYMPAGGGDLAGFLYPTYSFAQEWILRGVLPLWNPYILGGTPFLGDIQTALFYPLNLVTYLLSNPLQYRDLEYLAVLHFYIAGAGMYSLLRFGHLRADARPLHRVAALGGAVAFAFSDLFVTHFGNLNLIASAAWLPLIFLFFARAIHAPPVASERGLARYRRTIMFSFATVVVLAFSFFAGHIQPYLFILLTLALYTGYVIATNRADWKRPAVVFTSTLVLSTCLSAVTFLPALELTTLSVRNAFTYQDAAQYSLPPIELVGLIIPGFFGRGPENAWGPWARVEVGYLGVFPLLLAGLALVLRRNSKTMFFAVVSLVGLVLALGGYAILHGWLYQFVPGFGQLRAPARFILIMDFGLAVLAGIGFDAVLSPLHDAVIESFRRAVRTGAWLALLVALVGGALGLGILILGQGQDPALFQRIANAANSIGFFILLLALAFALLFALVRGWLPVRTWGLAALGLIFFDLFSLGAYVDIGHSDPTLGYQRTDIVEFLKQNTGLARIDSHTDAEGLWRPDTGLLYRLQDVYGDNPLVLENFNAYWENAGGRDSPAYQLLNVKYVLARRGTPMPANFVQAFQGGGGITVWENQTAAARAMLVTSARVIGNGIEFDPSALGPASAVTITGYAPNEILAGVNAERDGYLVFSEVYAPGWRAFLDGQETPVLRANNLFRAMPISAGAHQIRLFYDPLPFKVGALLTILALLVILGTLGRLYLVLGK